MKFNRLVTLCAALLLAAFLPASVRAANPIISDVFTADPAALVHGDTVYLYAGQDEAPPNRGYTMRKWVCYSSKDMKTWTSHGSPLAARDFKWAVGDAWASQVIEKNGKFYWYSTVQHNNSKPGKAIGVAVSDSPTGPFKDARGSALISDDMTPKGKVRWEDIDPTVFTDTDGTTYLYWGNSNCYYAKLKPNMTEIDGPIVSLDLPHYTEAPWIHKRGNLYYLSYASEFPEKMAYATAPTITGPWTPRGVMTDFPYNSNTIHQAIIEFKGQWYFIYHNGALPNSGGSYRRSVCVDYLYYNPDGSIKPVVQTTQGTDLPPAKSGVEATIRAAATSSWFNPLVRRRADPQVTLQPDGNYYLAATVPEYDRIELRRALTLNGLSSARARAVWRRPASGPMSGYIWAPELHRINGKWYVYFAGGQAPSGWNIHMYVLENESPDPFSGTWTEKGEIKMNWESFTLDATTFEHRGVRYLAWAQSPRRGGGTDLYIAKMDTPWSIIGAQVLISKPELPWELRGGVRVNEAPAVLIRNGRVFMTYSASATDANYCLGMLTADEGADLLDPNSWKKSPEPVLSSSRENSQFGPGHNSFTTTPDGQTDILVYHARNYEDVGKDPLHNPDRATRAQVIRWKPDSTPDFGAPVPDGPLPSGAVQNTPQVLNEK